MVGATETCALCGLKITPPPVVEAFDGEDRHFCCQGCARVYHVAHENHMLDQVLPKVVPKRPGFPDLILTPGETAYFSLDGMWCAGCAVAAEQVLRHKPGVKDVNVSFAAERGRIQYDPAQVDPAVVLRTLDSLGYQAHLVTDPAEQRAERRQENILLQLVVALAFGMQVMALYLVQLYPRYAAGDFNAPDIRRLQYVVWLLTSPVLLIGGSSFLRGAWRALRARTATMDTLVALGALSGYGYSVYVTLTGSGQVYFDSVAMITQFVMLGRFIETLGGSQARKDIRRLLKLQPANARRRLGEVWQEVQAGELAPGDTILIRPGERVPADANVLTGEGTADESLLTGESLPVSKGPGDMVWAGTVVTDSALTARVTHTAADTRLAHITLLVDQTLAAKPPIQRLADRASAYFAYGILGLAVLTALGWWFAGRSGSQALLSAVAVLVVACPCALGLATPLALAVTLGRSAQAGVVVRNPAALETAARIQRIVFDKTGTLTSGQMGVVAVAASPALTSVGHDLLCLAAAVEQFSEHPVAKAIVGACSRPLAPTSEFQALRGMGASARVTDGTERRVLVGSSRFLGVDDRMPLAAQARAHAEQGETVVWIGWDGEAAGFIALRDGLNPTAREALGHLQTYGIAEVMLSGDNPLTTRAIAAELGLVEFEGNCPPQDKAARIRAWQGAGERVAMVGDGVNDAPALAAADLSITAAGGTDIAGETSDVILTRADLRLIPLFLQLSRRSRRIILENLAWAFAYNLMAVPLAVLGIISPVIAALAMTASSLVVVANSLRLRH